MVMVIWCIADPSGKRKLFLTDMRPYIYLYVYTQFGSMRESSLSMKHKIGTRPGLKEMEGSTNKERTE